MYPLSVLFQVDHWADSPSAPLAMAALTVSSFLWALYEVLFKRSRRALALTVTIQPTTTTTKKGVMLVDSPPHQPKKKNSYYSS